MEYPINPYSYVGTVISKEEFITLVCQILAVPVKDFRKNTRVELVIDARLIISSYLIKHAKVSITELPDILKVPVKRSTLNIGMLNYDERYKFNSTFKSRVDKVKINLKKLNIDDKNIKII